MELPNKKKINQLDFLNNEIKNNDNEKPNFLNKSISSSKNNNQNESIENLKQKISSIIENKTFRNWKKFNNETNLNATSIIVAHIEGYFKINETV